MHTLKDISKLELSGAIFDKVTSFDLFEPNENKKPKTNKGAILYGRNGAGKSTIAKAFRKLGGETVPTITSARFCTDTDQPVTLDEVEKSHIFVFDEDFVDKNVKFQEERLDTIVMLGPAAGLKEKIEKAEKERDSAKVAYDTQTEIYIAYLDRNNPKSPKHDIDLLRAALQGDKNWAGRDKEIRGARQNTGVRDDTYKQFLKLKPSQSRTSLIAEYREKWCELEAAKSGASVIGKAVPTISQSYYTYDDRTVDMLLAEIVERPELSEREKKLFALLQRGTAQDLSQRLAVFRDEETTECPYCFQHIAPAYKASLVESIEKVLNKAVEDHQNNLRNCMLSPVSIDLTPFMQLDGYQLCADLLTETNAAIQSCNDYLRTKMNSPYDPVVASAISVGAVSIQLRDALTKLETARSAHDKKATATKPILDELRRINNEIAYYDVEGLAAQLEIHQQEYEAAKDAYQMFKTAYEAKEKEVEDLESQRKNVKLAIDAINACMKYIFFSEDRLRIEYQNGEYRLLSHGKSVKPCNVSSGERNIIGLCYFFASILEKKEEKNAYRERYLLVIDDPVSSHDTENRIGILSFLKYKLGVFLEGNQDTRVLLMTHDLRTFYDMDKLLGEIMNVCKGLNYPGGPKYGRFELREGQLSRFAGKRQEYTELIHAIYNYASGNVKEYDIVIGNMMRQVLEAFSTFEYKKGIEEVSTDRQILDVLPEKEYVSYYRNLMYRLVLHGGSHREEQIQTMNDFTFFSLMSEAEKMRTAKDILCFIYLLNRLHLLVHLNGVNGAEANLNAWCQDIKARAAII